MLAVYGKAVKPPGCLAGPEVTQVLVALDLVDLRWLFSAVPFRSVPAVRGGRVVPAVVVRVVTPTAGVRVRLWLGTSFGNGSAITSFVNVLEQVLEHLEGRDHLHVDLPKFELDFCF